MLKKLMPILIATAAVGCVLPMRFALAEPMTVGAVDKVQEEVVATQAGAKRPLAIAGPVFFRDKLRTGAGARMEAKLDDGTVLTLGEKGRMTIDDFVYHPGERGGKLAIHVAQGAFLFVGGKIEGPNGGNVDIKTPVGTLGVRGTTVWGGHIDGGFGVLVLKGEVWVKTKHGTVVLKEGTGTMVYDGKAPLAAAPWPADRTTRAVGTISFKQVAEATPACAPWQVVPAQLSKAFGQSHPCSLKP